MKEKKNKNESTFLSNLYQCLVDKTLIPLIIMILTPQMVILLPYIIIEKNSDLRRCFLHDSILSTLSDAWQSVKWTDSQCWLIIIILLLWGILSLYLPGRHYYGPPTGSGFRPEYWHNGFLFYIISMLVAVPAICKFSVLHLYYKIPTFSGILIVFGFGFCLFLYFKGLLKPDRGLHVITKNPIHDYYWGIELYPHLGRFVSLKLLIICRFSLLLWQLIVLVAWKANYELRVNTAGQQDINWPLTASTLLQTIYLAKFYYWEDGYMLTLDPLVEKFGFYIAWGCIAFVPGFYPLTSLYLVKHSPTENFGFGAFHFAVIFGLIVIALNYWSDRQRQLARKTNGKCIIWGKPAKVIRALYTDEFGKSKESILLASGFWGIARHMNYSFELLSALSWSLPALISSPIPYFYVLFLSILLPHRALRDEERCRNKYGSYWEKYCLLVPHKMIPGFI